MALDVEQIKKVRRSAIALARRRQQPGTGSSHIFLAQRTASMQWYDLSSVLSQVDWAVVGAVATRHYMPERMTRDLDVAVAARDANKVRQKLQEARFTYQGELSIRGSQWVTPDGQEIDVLEGVESWWPIALKEAQNNRDLQGLPVLPLPYLVLMKFRASRLQDIADLSRMLGQASSMNLEQVRTIFKQYTTADEQEDLESIIQLGKLETGSSEI